MLSAYAIYKIGFESLYGKLEVLGLKLKDLVGSEKSPIKTRRSLRFNLLVEFDTDLKLFPVSFSFRDDVVPKFRRFERLWVLIFSDFTS